MFRAFINIPPIGCESQRTWGRKVFFLLKFSLNRSILRVCVSLTRFICIVFHTQYSPLPPTEGSQAWKTSIATPELGNSTTTTATTTTTTTTAGAATTTSQLIKGRRAFLYTSWKFTYKSQRANSNGTRRMGCLRWQARLAETTTLYIGSASASDNGNHCRFFAVTVLKGKNSWRRRRRCCLPGDSICAIAVSLSLPVVSIWFRSLRSLAYTSWQATFVRLS